MLAMASKPLGDRSSVRLMKLPAALLTRPVRAPPAQTVVHGVVDRLGHADVAGHADAVAARDRGRGRR